MFNLLKKSDRIDWSKKRVIITGAAQGIGEALAHELIACGARVGVLDRDFRALATAFSEEHVPATGCDITDCVQLGEEIEGLVKELGGLDVVVANAGVADEAPIIGGRAALRRAIEVNLIGTDNTVQVAMPFLSKGGYILLASSLGAAINLPLMGAYSASKAAIEAYGTTLQIELQGTGIRVGTSFFSQLDTEMTKKFDSPAAQWIMSRRFLWLLHRVVPLEMAIDAIVEGIARRSAVVVAPRRARYVRWFRVPIQEVVKRWVGDVQTALAMSREV